MTTQSTQLKPFIDALEKSGIVSREHLDGLQFQGVNGESFSQALIRQEIISETDLLRFWAREAGFVVKESFTEAEVSSGPIRDIPIHFLKKNAMFPISLDNKKLLVAISDPLHLEASDQLRTMLGCDQMEVVLSPSAEIIAAINQAYGQVSNGAEHIIQDLDEDEGFIAEIEEQSEADLLDETSEAPIIKLVNHILSQAVHYQASDIHIEPYQNDLKVRYRMDGVLYDILNLQKRLHPAVASRVKILAGLNIAEKRVPQDGRIQIRIGNREIDLRVSSLPTAFGERLVLRILEKDLRVLNLQEIGLASANMALLKKLIRISHGIILVTGPTGSGKTTTLYSALNEINTPDKNILTIEDPIEYQLNGIGQMQVNSKIGVTFASGLRSMVRQDPDVILVGEIRDQETAEIAIQAALTGHLVFSTLHTNDASGAITRIIDMGIEPFLVSSSVQAILAQRLIRTLCPKCKQEIDPGLIQEEVLDQEDVNFDGPVFTATGCDFCMNTGYKGRSGIFEFLQVTETIQSLILKTSESNVIRKKAREEGMLTLRQDGVQKVLQGLTTLDEVFRVTQV